MPSLSVAERESVTNILEVVTFPLSMKSVLLFIGAVISSNNIESLATSDNLQHEKPEKFNRQSYIAKVGRDPVFVGTAFKLKAGAYSKPVKGNKGYYIIKLIESTDFNSTDFDGKKEAMKNELLSQKMQTAFNQWYTALKEDAEIIDNRKEFLR